MIAALAARGGGLARARAGAAHARARSLQSLPMSNDSQPPLRSRAETVHAAALGLAGLGLLGGLLARDAFFVNTGVSLILFLPPLRLATTIATEAHARHYAVAFMGVVVLAMLFISRRVS